MSESAKIIKIDNLIKKINSSYTKERLKTCIFKFRFSSEETINIECVYISILVSIITQLGVFLITEKSAFDMEVVGVVLLLLLQIMFMLMSFIISIFVVFFLSSVRPLQNIHLIKLIYPIKELIKNNQIVEETTGTQAAKFLINYYERHNKLPVEDKYTFKSINLSRIYVLRFLENEKIRIKNNIANSLSNENGDALE